MSIPYCSTMFALNLVRFLLGPNPTTSSVSDPEPDTVLAPTLDLSRPLPVLPPELVQDIVSNLATPLLPPSCAPYDSYQRERKTVWKSLIGVASSSKYYRDLLVRQWFYVLVVVQASDWDLVRTPAWLSHIQPHVRCVIRDCWQALSG
ncbi:hypothetical protein FRC08_009070 [Ceratobasidium sp. 394]|nr:hypothetical protein FRC08_009070 [Ceratobasidium sp. 394]